MLDIREAEYGGEMLYINKSVHHPMWATEYCRDEGLRKYWDEYLSLIHIYSSISPGRAFDCASCKVAKGLSSVPAFESSPLVATK